MTTRAEPEDHLWSADHSLRNAALHSFSYEASTCILFMASPFGGGVSKQFRFYEIGLSALRPTPSNPGGQVGCFFFFRSLPANLPGPYGRLHQ